MKPFYRGLLLGYILKEKINDVIQFVVFNGLNVIHKIRSRKHSKLENGINKINFVLKITNKDLFNEIFDRKNPSWWKFFPEKNVLKIELDG